MRMILSLLALALAAIAAPAVANPTQALDGTADQWTISASGRVAIRNSGQVATIDPTANFRFTEDFWRANGRSFVRIKADAPSTCPPAPNLTVTYNQGFNDALDRIAAQAAAGKR